MAGGGGRIVASGVRHTREQEFRLSFVDPVRACADATRKSAEIVHRTATERERQRRIQLSPNNAMQPTRGSFQPISMTSADETVTRPQLALQRKLPASPT